MDRMRVPQNVFNVTAPVTIVMSFNHPQDVTHSGKVNHMVSFSIAMNVIDTKQALGIPNGDSNVSKEREKADVQWTNIRLPRPGEPLICIRIVSKPSAVCWIVCRSNFLLVPNCQKGIMDFILCDAVY